MPGIGKILIYIGLVLVGVGLLFTLWDKLGLSRLPLGRLPGDIHVSRPGFSFHFPWVTCLVISIVVTLLLSIFRR